MAADHERALEAVRRDGFALEGIPQELRTPEVCEAAVRQNAWALRFVPHELRSKELCLMAVLENEIVMPYVPEGMQDGLRRFLLERRAQAAPVC